MTFPMIYNPRIPWWRLFMSRPLFAVMFLLANSLFAQSNATPEHDRLNKIIEDEWQFELRSSPEFATYIGDPRYNAEVSDVSSTAIAANVLTAKQFLSQLEALNAGTLSAADDLNRTLLMRRLRDRVEEARFKPWEMPVDQMNGIHSEWAQLPAATAFKTKNDYDDYAARLAKFPRLVNQVI